MLTEQQLDAIREIINIGMGRGASVLNEMLNSHIHLELPELDIIEGKNLKKNLLPSYSSDLSGIFIRFDGEMKGDVELIFNSSDAAKLVSAVIPQDCPDDEMDEMKAAALCEIGNIVINSVLGSISNILSLNLRYTVPLSKTGSLDDFMDITSITDNAVVLLAKTRFNIKALDVSGHIMLFFSLKSFAELKHRLDAYTGQNT